MGDKNYYKHEEIAMLLKVANQNSNAKNNSPLKSNEKNYLQTANDACKQFNEEFDGTIDEI